MSLGVALLSGHFCLDASLNPKQYLDLLIVDVFLSILKEYGKFNFFLGRDSSSLRYRGKRMALPYVY